MIEKIEKELARLRREGRKERIREEMKSREWYALRSILGNSWAMFYFLLGGREAGKSYSVIEFFVSQWRKYGRPFYWLRLTDTSQRKLLNNNADKLIDPDIRRRYNLDIITNGDAVYEVLKRDDKGKITEKKLMARVLALSTFYNDKGSGLFDKDFLDDPKMFYNICLDEMNREQNEKKSFDIVYAFANQLENLVRSTKQRLRVICIGNTLEEASDILCAFNFIPEEFGRYKLKSKRAVIEYIEPTDAYKERRRGTVADILMPLASTFTNKIDTDKTLVNKKRMIRPQYVIAFNRNMKFTVWDEGIVAKFNGEQCKEVVPMLPYLDMQFNVDRRNKIFELFDCRFFQFHDLITFKEFQKHLSLLRPKK